MESGKKSLTEREIAIKYAQYLKEHNLKPGDATFIDPEELGLGSDFMKPEAVEPVLDYAPVLEKMTEQAPEKKPEHKAEKKTARKAKTKPQRKTVAKAPKKPLYKSAGRVALENATAAPLFLFDRIADTIDARMTNVWQGFLAGLHKMVLSYKSAKKTIGRASLAIVLMIALVMLVFDKFTVYEYAYNGKTLGYVESQDDVTNVLDVAGEQLNEVNTESEQEIEFTANENISFKRVIASGKDTDDADTTVNKLAYMTDIEVEASGIYDGDNLVTIVKDESSAERLLAEVKSTLGTPDEGMKVVSVDFDKPLSIKKINILLTSVQSYSRAKTQMTSGGPVKFYHLVEEDETINSIGDAFGVDVEQIYDENNKTQLKEVSRGDKICIRKEVKPVSVKLVETGKMKEIVPYETIKKNSKKYYIGDEVVDVEGVDGVQIFEGTLTKIGGKITDRDTKSMEVLTKKVDEVILVGITKRPKTAPTGIFKNPMVVGSYIVTSRPGWRWGRTHEGVDMAAPTGTAVYASDGGKIIRAGWFSGYGYCIEIQHNNGWMTRYGHLSSIGVSLGSAVYQGQYIGAVGSTGHSTGPHLHFETRLNGAFVNPDTKVKGGL